MGCFKPATSWAVARMAIRGSFIVLARKGVSQVLYYKSTYTITSYKSLCEVAGWEHVL